MKRAGVSSLIDFESDVVHYDTIQEIHPSNTNQTSNVRISFKLFDPAKLPFEGTFTQKYKCKIGSLSNKNTRSGLLPPSLMMGYFHENDMYDDRNGGRVLDFTTTISTNLNILQIGDSITMQLAEAIDEMLLTKEQHGNRLTLSVLPEIGTSGTIVAPTAGGGVHGAWRLTGLWSYAKKGMPENLGQRGYRHAEPLGEMAGGWNDFNWRRFTRHEYKKLNGEKTTPNFDAIIFRVPFGWMEVETITRARIIEAAEMAKKILGASTFVFLTVPFNNNVENVDIYKGVKKVNDMIWDIAANWQTTSQFGNTTHFLVMDYAKLNNHVIWANARHMGYKVTHPLHATQHTVDTEGPTFLLERLVGGRWPPSIPQVCDKKPSKESGKAYCERNILFNDGMHFCPETLSARMGAAIACLLGCVYNRLPEEEDTTVEKKSQSSIRECERQCNDQFMSVLPLKESWVVSENSYASFSR